MNNVHKVRKLNFRTATTCWAYCTYNVQRSEGHNWNVILDVRRGRNTKHRTVVSVIILMLIRGFTWFYILFNKWGSFKEVVYVLVLLRKMWETRKGTKKVYWLFFNIIVYNFFKVVNNRVKIFKFKIIIKNNLVGLQFIHKAFVHFYTVWKRKKNINRPLFLTVENTNPLSIL